MSTLSRQKVWVTGDTLTASDLNAEFNNIMNDYNGSIDETNLGTIKNITLSNNSSTTTIDITNTSSGDAIVISS